MLFSQLGKDPEDSAEGISKIEYKPFFDQVYLKVGFPVIDDEQFDGMWDMVCDENSQISKQEMVWQITEIQKFVKDQLPSLDSVKPVDLDDPIDPVDPVKLHQLAHFHFFDIENLK